MNRIYPAVLLITILTFPAFGQEPDSVALYQQIVPDSLYDDSDLRNADSLQVRQPDYSHSTSKALMYALVLPGLGQAYNKRYYKIPIVWTAFGAVGYAIVFNTKNYRQASLDYALAPEDDRALNYWRRNMELSYIGLIVVYALQVLDSYVDAQLYNWDVNDDLSLRVAPSLQPLMVPASQTGQSYGLTCSFNFKGR